MNEVNTNKIRKPENKLAQVEEELREAKLEEIYGPCSLEQWEIDELEKEWFNSKPKFSDRELLEIFPQAKKVIQKLIKEWKEKRNKVLDAVKEKLTLIRRNCSDEFSRWFWREWVKVNEGELLLKIDENIARLERLDSLSKSKPRKSSILTKEMIEKALMVQIENVASRYTRLKRSGKNLVGLCPLHSEKHPSFFIYQETNSFYCYGCNKGGNVINLIMALENLSFKEAVKYLANHY